MKPNKPNAQEKRSTLETLHTLWVPMAVGAVLLVILAIVANLVWKDYSTALMESQTRQMELVVQSLADSIEFSLEEYLDRLDSAVAKVEANPDDKPTVAPRIPCVISGWRTTMAASFTAATALPP